MRADALGRLLQKIRNLGRKSRDADSDSEEEDRQGALTAADPLPPALQRQLIEVTEGFISKNAFASGLKTLLGYLDSYPESDHVQYMISMLIHAGMGLGRAYQAAGDKEGLTTEMLLDSRLDPLFNECSQCRGTWVSTLHRYPAAHVTVTNPVGGHCTQCDRVFCRECLRSEQQGVSYARLSCPSCGGSVEPVGKPTGRSPRQARRLELPIEFVLFLREGPVPPDGPYMMEVFRKICPDILDGPGKPRISAYPLSPWKDPSGIAMALLARSNPEYLSPDYLIDETEGGYDGDRLYIARVCPRTDVKRVKKPEVQELPPAERGVFFWFDWSKISESGHSMYGRYVYERLLKPFSPRSSKPLSGFYGFLDGDFIGKGRPVQLPYRGAEERKCVEEILRRGADVVYAVGIFGRGSVGFEDVDRALREQGTLGYLGMTSCGGRESFYQLTEEISLVPALILDGARVLRKDFHYLLAEELQKIGFEEQG